MNDPRSDTSTILDEGRFGYAAPLDTSGEMKHLPKSERKEARARRKAYLDRMIAAKKAREDWAPEQIEAEEARLGEEKAILLAKLRKESE